MAKATSIPPESFVDMPFPLKGLNVSTEYDLQPGMTSPEALNVRAFEPETARARGGQRPGLVRYIDQTVNGVHLIQHLNAIVDPTTDALLDNYDYGGDDAYDDGSGLRLIRPGGTGRQPNKNKQQNYICLAGWYGLNPGVLASFKSGLSQFASKMKVKYADTYFGNSAYASAYPVISPANSNATNTSITSTVPPNSPFDCPNYRPASIFNKAQVLVFCGGGPLVGRLYNNGGANADDWQNETNAISFFGGNAASFKLACKTCALYFWNANVDTFSAAQNSFEALAASGLSGNAGGTVAGQVNITAYANDTTLTITNSAAIVAMWDTIARSFFKAT